jgi:hypothetical protein
MLSFKTYSQFGLESLFKSNKYKTIVIYKNNDSIQGYSKDFAGFKFYFNKKKKGKYKKIKIVNIKKIIVNETTGKVVYHHIIEKGKKKEKDYLVKLVYDGNIKLFSHRFQSHIGGSTQYNSHSTPYGTINVKTSNSSSSYNTNVLYIKRENEKYASNITMAKIGGRTNKSLRKYLFQYFEDCSSLQNKIMSEELTRNDIIEILEFYDDKCYNRDKN